MKKLCLVVVMLLNLFSLVSCGEEKEEINYLELYGPNFKEENLKPANKDNLYGMCDLAWSEYAWNKKNPIDYKMTSQLIQNIGCKSARVWLHCNWIMTDPNTYDEEGLALARAIVEDLVEKDFFIIGMNHSNFHASGYANSSETVSKPERDLTEGSYYLSWLEDYKTTWYNLVKAFPEITYWEIDNEPNNDVFFSNLAGGNYNLEEKAAIYTDMMYFASLGIHEANPNATTVMGGLVVGTAEAFLNHIYDYIYAEDSWSKYPDDYFQVACWHPYMTNFSKTKFQRTNDDIYNVIKTREGKDKKVVLTEYGFSETNVSLTNICKYLPQIFEVFEASPYIESTYYFRMYDVLGSTWGSASEKQFGLFTDPTSYGLQDADGIYTNPILAAPKNSAYVFQQYAKGQGSLTLYQELLNK